MGYPGTKGPEGLPGGKGSQGGLGTRGEMGERGSPGGKGPTGPQGKKGPRGVVGTRGEPGYAGERGEPGERGREGGLGSDGNEGFIGDAGDKGISGDAGPKGFRGISGESGPPGPPGPILGLHRLAHYNYLDQSVQNLKEILYMSSTVENYKFPVGSKENPAMTCKELMDVDNIQDGYFWIDPNLGCPADAIRVYCNFTAGGESCVPPLRNKIPKKAWRKSPKASWNRFSNLEQGFKIKYTASRVQFNFLRLLSTRVRQAVTVKCKRIVVWFHKITKSYRYSWIFHGRKGFDFTPTSNPKPKVIRDYCSRDDGKWRRTEFTFDFDRADVLPIEDMSFFHRAVGNEQFGVKIGPVCYR